MQVVAAAGCGDGCFATWAEHVGSVTTTCLCCWIHHFSHCLIIFSSFLVHDGTAVSTHYSHFESFWLIWYLQGEPPLAEGVPPGQSSHFLLVLISLFLADKADDELEMTTVCHRPEGLEQLEAQTNFTKQELQILYRGFKNVIQISSIKISISAALLQLNQSALSHSFDCRIAELNIIFMIWI